MIGARGRRSGLFWARTALALVITAAAPFTVPSGPALVASLVTGALVVVTALLADRHESARWALGGVAFWVGAEPFVFDASLGAIVAGLLCAKALLLSAAASPEMFEP